jgi:hypothetical protein
MDKYNEMIANRLLDNVEESIQNLPAPTMFGGKRPRKWVLPGSTEYDYPATLAVGSLDGKMSDVMGGSFWKDFGKGFKKGFVGTAKAVAPFAPLLMGLGRDGEMSESDEEMDGGMVRPPIGSKGMMPRPRSTVQMLGQDGHGIRRMVGSAKPHDPVRDWMETIGKVVNPALLVGLGRDEMEGGKSAFEKQIAYANPLLWGYDLGHDVIAPALMGKKHGGKMTASKFFKKVGHAALPVVKEVGKEVLPVFRDAAKDVAKEMLKAYLKEQVKNYQSGLPIFGGSAKSSGFIRMMAARAKAGYADPSEEPVDAEGKINEPFDINRIRSFASPALIKLQEKFNKEGIWPDKMSKKKKEEFLKKYSEWVAAEPERKAERVTAKAEAKAIKMAEKEAEKEAIKAAKAEAKMRAKEEAKAALAKAKTPKKSKAQMKAEEEMMAAGYGGALIRNVPSEFHSSVYPPALASYRPRGGAIRKPSARGEIVKKVMAELGISLPEASKYVKEHGLY